MFIGLYYFYLDTFITVPFFFKGASKCDQKLEQWFGLRNCPKTKPYFRLVNYYVIKNITICPDIIIIPIPSNSYDNLGTL